MNPIDASRLWTPAGWQRDRRLHVATDGRIGSTAHAGGGEAWVVPGIANLHSHAFQRAMAGLAERRGDATHGDPANDSFWTWRETMYRFAARVGPESLHAIACQLYVEMLEAGYTSVCEFHYLHHAPDGQTYAEAATMSHALIAAARDTGIRLTLLPVLYMTGGFDGRELSPRQRRFGHQVDAYLHLLDTLAEDSGDAVRIGVALHSLRAVPPGAMAEVLAAIPPAMPVHVHIAEQVAEVDECVAVRGARPVQWLLDNAPVDWRWTLVHATHLDDAEVQGIAGSGATVAICPTTEANLGDGLFPLRAYLDAGGAWGIGSDSHVSVSPIEELRWLEYGQRLQTRQRNIVASGDGASVGDTLMAGVVASAQHATGHAIGALVDGAFADAVVLDTGAPAFAGLHERDAIDRWVFNGNRNLVRDVLVGGVRVVENGRHRDRDAVAARFGATMVELLRD